MTLGSWNISTNSSKSCQKLQQLSTWKWDETKIGWYVRVTTLLRSKSGAHLKVFFLLTISSHSLAQQYWNAFSVWENYCKITVRVATTACLARMRGNPNHLHITACSNFSFKFHVCEVHFNGICMDGINKQKILLQILLNLSRFKLRKFH